MLTRILFILAFGIFSLTFSSCGDDVSCNDENELINAFNAAVTSLNPLAQAFGNDPTEANCEAYLDGLRDFIDELENFQSCADDFGRGTQWRQDISAARNNLDDVDCTP